MLNINEIIEATNGKLINGNGKYTPLSYEIDSRSIKKDDFFIPIKGEKTDAHKYIVDCVKNGVCGFFINKNYIEADKIVKECININKNICIIEVEDTLKALINSGKFNRKKHIDIPLVAVTGSVGKTSTREMIASVLKEEKNILVTKKNYNSNIGTSLMCLEIDNQDICVFEAGIDKFGEMEELSNILQPDIVVITIIGTAHIGTFKTKENIFLEKSKIINCIKGIKKVITNGDDTYLSSLVSNNKYDVEKISVDNVDNVITSENSIEFYTRIYGDKLKIKVNQIGDHNIYNTLIAIKVAECFNMKKENIINGISNYQNFVGRLKRICINDIVLFDDTYNASSESMRSGLLTINRLESKRKFAILGDIFDLGDMSDEIHTKLADMFSITNYDFLYTLGNQAKKIANGAKIYMKDKNIKCFDSADELVEQVIKEAKKGDILYFKASHGMNFTELIEKVKEKLHNI